MNIDLFKNGVDKLGLEITEVQVNKFSAYSGLLKEWNERMNLTAIVDDDGISVKHFLDSILSLGCVEIPQNASLADIGTGAGFPGIPVKIMRDDLNVTLIDSLKKRITFLEEVGKSLELTDVSYVHGRAEELGKNNKYREKFDVVVSRAVANLKVLCEYCLPFIKVGGMFIALKAEDIEEELDNAKAMIGSLGGVVEDIKAAELPESDIVRKLIIIRKDKPTPLQFPRRPNKIKQA